MKLRVGGTVGLLILLIFLLTRQVGCFSKPQVREANKVLFRCARQPIILGQSRKILALKDEHTRALYNLKDGTFIHAFWMAEGFERCAISADEQWLVGCHQGDLSVWDIQSGQQLWQQGRTWSGLGGCYDLNFSWAGLSFVVCDGDRAAVYHTRTGRKIQTISAPPGDKQWFRSSTLSPDGSKGVLLTISGQLHTVDVTTGTLKDTGITARDLVRYSSDGKYIACNSPGTSNSLRIVELKDPPAYKDVKFGEIGCIRPAADGSFVVVGSSLDREYDVGKSIGLRYHPGEDKAKQLWPPRLWNGERRTIKDVDADLMLGISSSFELNTLDSKPEEPPTETNNLRTEVWDLRSGTVVLTIHSEEEQSSRVPASFQIAGVVALVVLILAILRRYRSRKSIQPAQSS